MLPVASIGSWPRTASYCTSGHRTNYCTSKLIFVQQRDAAEGADIIMVKPALPYLDIIADAAQLTPDHPIACYQVSGEFAMIHAGAKAGVYALRTMAFESVEGMVRAGMCHIVPLEL